MDKIVRRLSHLKNQMTKSDFEALMHKATSNDPTFISDSQIRSLVARTNFPNEQRTLMDHLWNKLNGPKNKWRKILKALYIIREIIESGSREARAELKTKIAFIKILEKFNYYEDGVDRGKHISELATKLVIKIKNMPDSKPGKEQASSKNSELEENVIRTKLQDKAVPKAKKEHRMEDLGFGKDFLDYNENSEGEESQVDPPRVEMSNIFPRENSSDFEQFAEFQRRSDSDIEEPEEAPRAMKKQPPPQKPVQLIDDDFLDF